MTTEHNKLCSERYKKARVYAVIFACIHCDERLTLQMAALFSPQRENLTLKELVSRQILVLHFYTDAALQFLSNLTFSFLHATSPFSN